METIVHTLVGGNGKAVLLVAPDDIEWPTVYLDDFDTCCGPGTGIGDLVVPDRILGLKVSAACFVHDFMWKYCDTSWGGFHYSNSVFLHNLLAIIDGHRGILRHIRSYIAMTYYVVVDSLFKIFWKNKGTPI